MTKVKDRVVIILYSAWRVRKARVKLFISKICRKALIFASIGTKTGKSKDSQNDD